MSFEVNGITFSKEELAIIAMKDLKIGSISHVHLFFIPASGKSAFLILRAGDYIDQEFVDKYTHKGMSSFHALEVAKTEEISLYRSLFASLKNTMNEKERLRFSQNILKQFGTDFWKDSQVSILSYSLTCFEQFYNLPDNVVEKYKNTSLTLYSRAMISASMSIITCFAHRITDLAFIKDLYNAIFALDYGLLEEESFSYAVISACEAERNAPGTGIVKLQSINRSAAEITFFRNHPTKSAEFIETMKDRFQNPEVIDIIRYHHEKGDGSGFPNEISYSGISDIETFQMFCDYIVPFNEHIYKKGDGAVLRQEFEKLKNNDEMLSLPVNKVIAKWEACMSWAVKEKPQEVNEQEAAA